MMDERYHMTKADNIFTAKRNIVDYIYKSARLEGIAVTFPQTEAVYAGGNAASLSRDDIVVINNLKHAWQFVLDTVVFEENIPPTAVPEHLQGDLVMLVFIAVVCKLGAVQIPLKMRANLIAAVF